MSNAELSPGLVLRTYGTEDDAACKALEISASQFQSFGGLIKAAIHHKGKFDDKPRQFDDYILLACEDKSKNGHICAVVAVAIKTALVHGSQQRCGFVFDLRVEEAYQKRGIGKAITKEAEKRAEARGCTYLYLSVNNDNRKARALYTSAGWTLASRRALVFQPLVCVRPASAMDAEVAAVGGGVQLLEAVEALALVTAHFAKRDLGLSASEFKVLFASHNMLGTFAASDGHGSRAVLSLWHGSSFNSFKPVRLLLPMSTWARLRVPLGCCGGLLVGYAAYAMLLAAPGPLTRLLVGAGFLAGAAAVGFMWNFLRTRTAFRARAFAPIATGPNWQPLMRAVHAHVLGEARKRGFGVMVINEDVSSPLTSTLVRMDAKGEAKKGGAPRSPTSFWQKALQSTPGSNGSGVMPSLQSDAFFDPRDI